MSNHQFYLLLGFVAIIASNTAKTNTMKLTWSIAALSAFLISFCYIFLQE